MSHVVVALLAILVAGSQAVEPQSFRVDTLNQEVPPHLPPDEKYLEEAEYDVEIRRYECPAGFFRLRRFCYYLSAGTAQWKEAHFACTARNASLAVLDKPQKDKILRKYLMGDQFRQLERWIGGFWNWKQNNWDWGVSGEKVKFKNFGITEQPKAGFSMSCIVLDPDQEYKWSVRSCLEQKYFICEVPAGRTGKSRRRKNITNDPLAPQNQRLRPSRRDPNKVDQNRRRKNKLKSMHKKNWHDDNQVWSHGVKLGTRHRNGFYSKRTKLGKGARHGRKNNNGKSFEVQLDQATPRPGQYGAFSGGHHFLGNSLSDEINHQNQLSAPRLGDIAHEEILLKLNFP